MHNNKAGEELLKIENSPGRQICGIEMVFVVCAH